MNKQKAMLCALLIGAPSLAMAAAGDPYMSLMGTYVNPDNARRLDDGVGASLILGFPVNRYVDGEVNLSGYGAGHDYDSGRDGNFSGGFDLRVGMPVGDGTIKPFALLGGGAAQDFVPFSDFGAGYANAGLGVLWALGGPRSTSVRLEVRRVAEFTDKYGTQDDNVYDTRVSLGAEVSLGARVEPPPPPPPEPTTVAKPADSDRDGVVDGLDLCPDTPPATPVDTHGCPLPPKDSDGDGVPDDKDACPNTTAGLKVDERGCAVVAQTLVLHDVNFELNSDALTVNAKGILDTVVNAMKGQPSMKMRIEGHTDSSGSAAYNLKLSERRAASVRNYLISKGIAAGRLTSKGLGESQPTASNKTADGRALNRRVEFHVVQQ